MMKYQEVVSVQTSQASQIVGIHTVGIPVTDQERALRFYVDVLGLDTRVDRPLGNGARWIEVGPAQASVTLALEPARGGLELMSPAHTASACAGGMSVVVTPRATRGVTMPRGMGGVCRFFNGL